MNASELAQKMLEWERLTQEANAIAAEIEAAVLEIGKTQTVGNVRASFANGRKSYDYETPAQMAATAGKLPDGIIHANSKTIVDWRAVCKAGDIEPAIKAVGKPSVSVKLLA